MALNLKPLGDRLIVEPIEQEEQTASGLYIPETAKEKPQQGLVVAVGPGRWDENGKSRVAMDVREGEKVLFQKYAGTEFKFRENGTEKKYLIFSEKDILAIVQ